MALFLVACTFPMNMNHSPQPQGGDMPRHQMMMSGSMPADALAPQMTENGLFEVTAISRLDPVTINEMHSWVLTVTHGDGTPVEDATIAVDGGMPSHNHGLPTSPEVTEYLGDGQYLVEGMRFSMGGEWVLDLTIEADGESDFVRFTFDLN
jgi:hypothetical protein